MKTEIEQITESHPDVRAWIDGGSPLAMVHGRFGELHCILKGEDHYSLLRCFWIGDRVAVSVDRQGSADALLAFLLEKEGAR